MVRLLYALLCLLLTAAVMLAAPPKAPPVAMPPKAPPVTINDSGVIVHAAPAVAAPRPFPAYSGTSSITAPPAVTNRRPVRGRGSSAATSGRITYTLVPSAGSSGGTNCPTFR